MMGAISDKLTYLADTKTAIRNAITAKGVTVSDSDTFRSYADKIAGITVGGDDDESKLHLYRFGNECIAATGGWNGRVTAYDGKNSGSFTKNDDDMLLISSGGGSLIFTIVETAEAIDFTGYSKLCAKVLAPTTNTSIYCDFGISAVPVNNYYNNTTKVVNSGKSADIITMSIDITNYQGLYYVNLLADLGNKLRVFKVWLEK